MLKRLGFSIREFLIIFSFILNSCIGKVYYRSADRTWFTLLYLRVQSYPVSQFCFRKLFRMLFWKCRFIQLPALDVRNHPFTQPILALVVFFFFLFQCQFPHCLRWLMHWWKWQYWILAPMLRHHEWDQMCLSCFWRHRGVMSVEFALVYTSECSSGSMVENRLLNLLVCPSFISLRNVHPILEM